MWCYESEYSGRETKQALSRYKVLTGAITTTRNCVSTTSAAGGLRGDARARGGRVSERE